jgi:N-acetylglutamate synthase
MGAGESADASEILGLEERALNAWPALQTVLMGGWILRFSEGYTKRANSACTLRGDAVPLAEIGWEIEALYERNGQRAIFRLTSLARAQDVEWLRERGYLRIEPTAVMTGGLPVEARADPGVTFANAPDEAWLAGFAAGNRYGPSVRPTLERMLAAIRPPAIYATVSDGGVACGYGLVVIERGRAGLFDILIEEHARRRGLGRRLVSAMLRAASAAGASGAYLQVLQTNVPAIALYRSLAFETQYEYAYFVRQAACRSEGRDDATC